MESKEIKARNSKWRRRDGDCKRGLREASFLCLCVELKFMLQVWAFDFVLGFREPTVPVPEVLVLLHDRGDDDVEHDDGEVGARRKLAVCFYVSHSQQQHIRSGCQTTKCIEMIPRVQFIRFM